ncbi:hypothetical protein HDE_07929 [Halotydeus destructor]|nr:hypothetical protein HDE_07929 [Halotydeus destructor]
MDKVTKLRIAGKICFVLFCAFGFLQQSTVLSDKYLGYLTLTTLEVKVPGRQGVPGFSLCLPYADVIDVDKVQSELGITINSTAMDVKYSESKYSDSTVDQLRQSITMGLLFELTPSFEDILDSCLLRNESNYLVSRFTGSDCLDRFQVSRFYVQDYVCYTMSPKEVGIFDFNKVKSHISSPGMVFEVGLKKKYLDRAHHFLPILHGKGRLPFRSLYAAPQVPRNGKQFRGKRHVQDFYHMSYYNIRSSYLPPPYVTSCSEYKEFIPSSQFKCLAACLGKSTLSSLGKYPFSAILEETESRPYWRHVTEADLKNRTVDEALSAIGDKCRANCSSPTCDSETSITKLLTRSFHHGGIMYFRLDLPFRANIFLSHSPLMDFVNYALQLMNCIGVWAGLSVFDLNPVVLVTLAVVYVKRHLVAASDGQTALTNPVPNVQNDFKGKLNTARLDMIIRKLDKEVRLIKLDSESRKEKIKFLIMVECAKMADEEP